MFYSRSIRRPAFNLSVRSRWQKGLIKMNMESIFENLDAYIIPIIVIACMCIGYVLKKWLPTDDKWIPTILLIIGGVSGILVSGFTYEGVAMGMLSAMASVGLHQVVHQHLKVDTFDEMTEEEAMEAMEEEEDDEEEYDG